MFDVPPYPGISYPEFMVAAQKAEGENNEIKERVKTKATMTTGMVEGVAELWLKITQLMAVLNQGGQGNCSVYDSDGLSGHEHSLFRSPQREV